MRVRRTLPQRHRALIGAWCFIDHYGPDEVDQTGGMAVAPHPHVGVQTATWLFEGEVEHRDSAGHHTLVKPGELNLMTAGRGVSHSEVSTAQTSMLHGTQLWVALPEQARQVEPGFDRFIPSPVRGPGWEARVFLGSLFGATSPVDTHTPLLGAEVMLAPGATLDIEVDKTFEHGVLLDVGRIEVEGQELEPGQLAYVAPGSTTLTLTAREEARLLLLGGTPFDEAIVMWWNFLGRSHEDIVEFRDDWEQEADRFGPVDTDLARIPAPVLPNVRLKLRH